jgi:hypothetical protein
MNDLWFVVLWISAHALYSLCALYYLVVLLPAYFKGRKHYVTNSPPTINDIKKLMRSRRLDKIPMFKFQITTKANETYVIKRGIRSILNLAKEPIFQNRLRIDVVTESPLDKKILESEFKDCAIPINIYVVPPNYRTVNNTLRKGRALQYMIDIRKKEAECERGYIVYFDSESVIAPIDFRRLVYNTIKYKKQITEGPIVYPINWFSAPLISRQMEATRPWNCYHCHKVMKNPPPQHLHGSNLVVEENLALELGWDFGNIDGSPFIAEDLIFGLKAYIKYGKRVFGWHGAELLEQPPLSVKDSVRQRIRWVTGVWQALEMLKSSKDFYKLKFFERFKIRTIIGYRTLIYSLGFFAALVFFFFMPLWVLSFFIEFDHFIIETFLFKLWRVLLLSGLILWLGSTQIGLSRILERKKISRKTEIIERIKILAITPIAAVIETSGALYATVKWFLGFRKVEWIPTKK